MYKIPECQYPAHVLILRSDFTGSTVAICNLTHKQFHMRDFYVHLDLWP
jgi:hypothetical protein